MEGKTLGVVECKNVEYKSERREPFLDIQLNVKGCASVYDSFDKLIEVDELVGDNKYDAEQHGMQDAIKYTKLESTPPVLFLHLKRFDFDLQALQQVKINDRFEFPSHLDLDQHSRKLFAESADPSVR